MEHALLSDDQEIVNSLMDYVIVGGGATGVELAGALSELKQNVSQRITRNWICRRWTYTLWNRRQAAGRYSEQASAKALKFLQEMGVKVHLNVAVKSYDGYEVIFNSGEKLISRTVIWAAGVKGNPIDGLKPENIARGNRVMVDAFNRVKGFEKYFRHR
ncbi:MAG: FAD-dependent oxidoreductase [Bacteroidota bacterium]